jgi:hypothetical protein
MYLPTMPVHIQSLADQAVAGRRGWSGPVGMTMTTTPPEPPAPPAPTPPAPTPPVPTDQPVEATDEAGRGLGFPKDTPTEKMTEPQRTSYWRNQSRVQEAERRKWEAQFAGKTPDEIQKMLDAAASVSQTEQERAIAAARDEGRNEGQKAGAATSGEETATLLLESYLENRIEDESRRKTLLTTVDVRTAVGEDGKVDPVKVKAIAEALAPKVDGRSGGSGADVGGGRRTSSTSSGMAAGKELFDQVRGRKSSNNDS